MLTKMPQYGPKMDRSDATMVPRYGAVCRHVSKYEVQPGVIRGFIVINRRPQAQGVCTKTFGHQPAGPNPNAHGCPKKLASNHCAHKVG